MTYAEAINAARVDYLTCLMIQTGGNVTKAAKIAGKDRATFYALLHKHCPMWKPREHGNDYWRSLDNNQVEAR